MIVNLITEVPIITRLWTLGSFVLSVASRFRLITPVDIFYNYDLVFKRGEYQRLLLSIFDYGEFEWVSMINIFITANHLSMLENTFALRRQYIWLILVLLIQIVLMTLVEQPKLSLGILLHENLVYYFIKKSGNQVNVRIFGNFTLSPMLVTWYMNAVMYFVYGKSAYEISMKFVPGHLLYYLDDVVGRLYHVDLLQTPYDAWLARREQPVPETQ